MTSFSVGTLLVTLQVTLLVTPLVTPLVTLAASLSGSLPPTEEGCTPVLGVCFRGEWQNELNEALIQCCPSVSRRRMQNIIVPEKTALVSADIDIN